MTDFSRRRKYYLAMDNCADQDSKVFRTISTSLAFAYIPLMIYQKISHDRFPSERYDRFRITMAIHIISGVFITYSGCFLHIQNEVSPVLNSDDENSAYQAVLYYIMGTVSCIHTATVVRISPFVMGEKRITIPLYVSAALVNLHNGILLISNPSLSNAFALWGSVNTFLYQRAILVPLMFTELDWELLYTFSLLAGASITYSLSNQQQYVYAMLIFPVLYAPFHEKVAEKFGFPLEDTMAGNKPSEKNVSDIQKRIRERMFSKKSNKVAPGDCCNTREENHKEGQGDIPLGNEF